MPLPSNPPDNTAPEGFKTWLTNARGTLVDHDLRLADNDENVAALQEAASDAAEAIDAAEEAIDDLEVDVAVLQSDVDDLEVDVASLTTGVAGGITAATLTTNGDILTRAAGVPARITRADLAADAAFTDRFEQLVGRTYPALRTFREALAHTRTTGGLTRVVVGPGDSFGEGYTASTFFGVWWRRLQLELQRGTERGHWGYIAAAPGGGPFPTNYPGVGTDVWDRVGDYVDERGGRGLGRRAIDLEPGATMTVPFVGTYAQIAYTKMSSSPLNGIRILCDGVGRGNINPYTIGDDESALSEWPGEPPQEEYGLHELTIENVGISGNIRIEGVHLYDGPADHGVYVADCSHSGYMAQSYATPDTDWVEAVALLEPHLIVLPIGLNDRFFGRTSAQYAADLTTICDAIDEACEATAPGILLVAWPMSPGEAETGPEPWVNYIAKMREVAALNPEHRAVVDLSVLMSGAELPPSMTHGDGYHPTNPGQQWMAERILEVIEPRSKVGNGQPAVRGPININAKAIPDGMLPGGILTTWLNGIVGTGGTGTLPAGTNYWQSDNGADVEELRYRVWFDAGEYAAYLTVTVGNNMGQAEVLVNNLSSGTLDLYGTTTRLDRKVGSSFTLPEDGWYCVTVRKTGDKNVLSSNTYLQWNQVDFVRSE